MFVYNSEMWSCWSVRHHSVCISKDIILYVYIKKVEAATEGNEGNTYHSHQGFNKPFFIFSINWSIILPIRTGKLWISIYIFWVSMVSSSNVMFCLSNHLRFKESLLWCIRLPPCIWNSHTRRFAPIWSINVWGELKLCHIMSSWWKKYTSIEEA